jgi:hypothetical protein
MGRGLKDARLTSGRKSAPLTSMPAMRGQQPNTDKTRVFTDVSYFIYGRTVVTVSVQVLRRN